MPGVAATVNGVPITIRELDDECLARHGRNTLEGMISRKVLELACQRRNITVTEEDIDREIAREASEGVKPRPDGSPDVQAWLDLITKKQGIPLDLYRGDVVWSAVVLKKLTGDKVDVDRGRPPQGLRGELRTARALPGDRAEQSASCPAGV